MLAALGLGVRDLWDNRRLAIAMILMVAIPFQGFLLLDGLARAGVFDPVERSDLIVQEAAGVGEIVGSRIPASIQEELIELGAEPAVAEVHSVIGTTAEDAVLVRGVELDRYHTVEDFEMTQGRALRIGDGPRTAMIGARLASGRGVGAGEQITLRGRAFDVVGVFTIGTYADNEAWLSIEGAQQLLGWGDEVSLFIVADGGPLAEGDRVGGLIVLRRGETGRVSEDWNPVGELLRLAAAAVTAASAFILAAVLWRLAWFRRRELAIMRALGLRRRVNAAYLGAQASIIAAAGLGLGVALALVISPFVRFRSAGITLEPTLDWSTTLSMLAGGGLVAALGAALPLVWLLRQEPAVLLRRN